MNEDRPPPQDQELPEERPPAEDRGLLPTEAPAEPSPGRPLPVGRLILGLVLVAVGVIWLLEALDVVSFSFLAVLPGALIIVGVALIGAARTGRHSGLITLGIVITVILTIASGFDIRLQGGVGERAERPPALLDVQREYHLSVGQLTIDLRSVDFSAAQNPRVKASVGLGQLTVRVPGDALVEARGHAGAGQVMIFGRQTDGFDVDLTARSVPGGVAFVPVDSLLTLDLSVGLGQIEVTR